MNGLRAQLLIGLVCLLLGVGLATQFRTQREGREDVLGSSSDQATYISELYESNSELRQQVEELSKELGQYQQRSTGGKSNLDSMVRDLQNLRIANGEVEVVGPGVTVTANGDLTVFELQDLVNELRNAAAEAIAVNGVRVVTRSAIVDDQTGRITIDRQPVARPYRLEAIGDPDTLAPALERKGGLIALLEAGNSALKIEVTRHDAKDRAGWLRLPKTALDFTWVYGQPAP
ncbi:MAG: DUF881 domain-containing protein [Chloroflexota bacterium]|nr:DUF881 domain-containing protein [Chloroflexota bacterium]